jgi:hypothetical protein
VANASDLQEVDLALCKGYEIESVHELWHWRTSSNELFRPLIRDQYKTKARASKLPRDPAEIDRLLKEYRDTLGLELKREEFREDASARAAAKQSLNSIWGWLPTFPTFLYLPTFLLLPSPYLPPPSQSVIGAQASWARETTWRRPIS